MKKMKKWKVKFYRTVGKKTIEGTFTLVAAPFQIRDMKLHKKNGARWVGFPSRSYEKNGELIYVNLVRITDGNTYDDFQQWCLAELDRIITPEKA